MRERAGLVLVGALLLIAVTVMGLGAQEVRGNGLIVDVAWLAQQLDEDDVVVLQVGPPELFAEEHVPGARPATHHDVSVRGELAMELPPVAELRKRLGDLGISDDSRIVLVHAGAWISPLGRVAFTLDYAGFGGQTFVLDGGLEAWKAAGEPVTAAVEEVHAERVSKPVQDRVVTYQWVQDHARDAGVTLVDARAPAFYEGVRDDNGSVGHIDGAVSLPWQRLVREDGGIQWFRSDEEIAQVFEEAGVGVNDTVVAYCHVGQFATATLLGARISGHSVKLYDGSMDQWRKLGLPLTTEPR